MKKWIININGVNEIKEVPRVPLVLHGGSGIADQDFTDAIKAGISIVHINTEIRVAYRDAVKQAITEHPDEVAPYKIMKSAVSAMEKVISERLKLFNHLS